MKKQNIIIIVLVVTLLLITYIIMNMKTKNVSNDQGLHTSSGYTLFKDNEFPFRFEYPADWNTVELSTNGRSANSVFDNKLKDILIGKDVSVIPESRKIGEWFVISKSETPFPSNARPASTKIVLDGREVNMYEVGSGLSVYIVQISVGSNVYEIQFNSKGVPSSQFEKLKSSFRFNGLFLFFYAGGSITGNSFEVGITGPKIAYREYGPDKKKLKRIDRSLTSVEATDIRELIMSSGLISLETENLLDQTPPQTDPGSYQLFVMVDSKRNENIQCYIPSFGEKPTIPCQKEIDFLRLKLNNILGVNIY